LPSLTQVSRADFFAGRRDYRAGDKHTNNDTNRWAANRWLLEANDQEALPALIMRDKLMDGESLHREVVQAIDSTQAVVGVVVNAIDEDLKGSSQTMRDYSREMIKPLTGLLTQAAGADRFVLLASDHGHVLGDAMRTHKKTLSSSEKAGVRWRTLGPHDEPMPFERVLPKSTTWCPSGAKRVAAIWDEKVAHKHPSYGTHGGLSMAEVVCPTVLIAPEWLAQLQPDSPELETRPFPHPGWWDLDLRPHRTKKAKQPKPRRKQTTIPGITPAPSPPTKAAASKVAVQDLPPLVQALQSSKVFKAQVGGQKP